MTRAEQLLIALCGWINVGGRTCCDINISSCLASQSSL